MLITGGLVTIMGTYMVALTVIGQPHKSAIVTTVSNETTYDIECSFIYPQFQTALFAVEAAILLAGARLCWAVKDVPDAVNESKFIAIGELIFFLFLIFNVMLFYLFLFICFSFLSI